MLPDFAAGTLDIMGSIRPLARHVQGQDPYPSLLVEPTLKIPFGEGISGRVFASGSPVVVPDVRAYPGYLDHGLDDVLSEIAVPLKRAESVVGVLDVGRSGVEAFSPDDLDVLSLFASQAAIAIENARLIWEQRRRADELLAIQTIIQKITPYHDPPTIAEHIGRELNALIDYCECRVLLLDQGTGMLLSLTKDASDPRLRLGEGFGGWVALHGQSDMVPNVLDDPRVRFRDGEPRMEVSMVGAPMVYKEHVRGAITLSKIGTNQFDENARRLLEIVAAQAAMAFDRARLYHELRIEAITDPVVKLHNRRYLMERFREERARAIRNGRPLACLTMDIDGFKAVNDAYGHDAGDAVLRELAGLIRGQVRTEDIAARYGGEEFCLLLPGTFQEHAAHIGERVRHAIATHHMPHDAGVDSISVSVGLAMLSPGDKNTEMFTRADEAMYRAKAAGRNQVVSG